MEKLFNHPPLWIKIPAAVLLIIVGIYPHILPDAAEPYAGPSQFCFSHGSCLPPHGMHLTNGAQSMKNSR